MNNDIAEVRAVLRKFQDGYTRRNAAEADAFVADLFAPEDDVLVIGTGSEEWCDSLVAIRNLVRSDWESWGDLQLEVDGAAISVRGDAAWLATRGTVSMTMDRECLELATLKEIQALIEGKSGMHETLLEILYSALYGLTETAVSTQFVWPLRFTAVLVKREDGWKFHQMQFSHSATRAPQERVTEAPGIAV